MKILKTFFSCVLVLALIFSFVAFPIKASDESIVSTSGSRDVLPSRGMINGSAIDLLQQSTLYGTWSNDFYYYNCYSFALGLTNGAYLPGSFSNGSNWAYSSILQIVQATISDLHSTALGYACARYTTTRPAYASLKTGETAICVRLALPSAPGLPNEDFHYMRLINNNTWCHKPGASHTLTFNTLPTNNVTWSNEAIFLLCEGGNEAAISYIMNRVVNGVYLMDSNNYVYAPSDTIYNSDIYYIIFATNHTYSNTLVDLTELVHGRPCDCGEYLVEPHSATVYTTYDASQHYGTCSCGRTFYESHTYGPCTYLNSTTHTHSCTKCGYTQMVPHSYTNSYVIYTQDSHLSFCACGIYIEEEHIFVPRTHSCQYCHYKNGGPIPEPNAYVEPQ